MYIWNTLLDVQTLRLCAPLNIILYRRKSAIYSLDHRSFHSLLFSLSNWSHSLNPVSTFKTPFPSFISHSTWSQFINPEDRYRTFQNVCVNLQTYKAFNCLNNAQIGSLKMYRIAFNDALCPLTYRILIGVGLKQIRPSGILTGKNRRCEYGGFGRHEKRRSSFMLTLYFPFVSFKTHCKEKNAFYSHKFSSINPYVPYIDWCRFNLLAPELFFLNFNTSCI
jgi:hypothetical protein